MKNIIITPRSVLFSLTILLVIMYIFLMPKEAHGIGDFVFFPIVLIATFIIISLIFSLAQTWEWSVKSSINNFYRISGWIFIASPIVFCFFVFATARYNNILCSISFNMVFLIVGISLLIKGGLLNSIKK